MHPTAPCPEQNPPHVQDHQTTLYASLELSRSTWLVTSLACGSRKMSKHSVAAGDGAALLALLVRLRGRVEQSAEGPVEVVVVQEAGRDGFWVHRLLEAGGIQSHVVDPASVAVPRRQRRAKTDVIDGETLLRTLLAWRRGEPRVCAMVVPPSPEEEDRRRTSRERATLLRERVRHVNRIKGLLAGQGIAGYEPILHGDRQAGLETLRTGDGRPLPVRLKAELRREVERLEFLLRQIAEVEAERDADIDAEPAAGTEPSPVALLTRLKAVGPQIAAVLYHEGLYRTFANRREVAAYAGLAPTPWRSGKIAREQGISKAGNPRLRHTMVELAWLWVRHQPDSALSCQFRARVGQERGRVRRVAIVALARRLLIALWRYVGHGEVPEGAVLKAA
jgi:transposase